MNLLNWIGFGNSELQYNTNRNTENARVENGHLVIEAKVKDHLGKNFTSARLFSRKAWQFGRYEARATVFSCYAAQGGNEKKVVFAQEKWVGGGKTEGGANTEKVYSKWKFQIYLCFSIKSN